MIHSVETASPSDSAMPNERRNVAVLVEEALAALEKYEELIVSQNPEDPGIDLDQQDREAWDACTAIVDAVWDGKVETIADGEAAFEFLERDCKANSYGDAQEKLYQEARRYLMTRSHGSRALELIARTPEHRGEYLFHRDLRNFALASVPEALVGLARQCAEYQALMTIHLSLEEVRDFSFFHFDGVNLESRRNRILSAPVASIDDAMAKLQTIETIRKGPYTEERVSEALQGVTAFLRDQAASLQPRAA